MRIKVLFALLLASACAERGEMKSALLPAVQSAEVERRGDVAVARWSSDVPVDVYATTDPGTALGTGQKVAEDIRNGAFQHAADGKRVYFDLVADGRAPVRTAARVVPLEGGRNFRDLGGYRTQDGRTVRWGHAFRSGVMSELTPRDTAALREMGIKVVCDFRTAEERASEPSRASAGGAAYVVFDDFEAVDQEDFARVLMDPAVTPADTRAMMLRSYEEIAYRYAEPYADVFDRLASGPLPLAFNCSAGKDRAGTMAALLLTALGVPRETVVADYALSERVVDYEAEFAEAAAADPEGPYAFLAQLPPEIVAPLMRSDPAYIETALDRLEAEHGSVRAFLRDEVGVTDEELEAIRDRLLRG